MGKRDEPGVERDFANTTMRVAQKTLGVLNAEAHEVVRETEPRMFLELFAEIKGADMQVLGDILQSDRFSKVFGHVLLGPGDEGWLSLAAL